MIIRIILAPHNFAASQVMLLAASMDINVLSEVLQENFEDNYVYARQHDRQAYRQWKRHKKGSHAGSDFPFLSLC